ncbi:helix-turn-helix domain-containing protein [Chloroflexota bacterium]
MSKQNRLGRNAKDKQYLLKIGDNIRTARKQRGYSQEEFADIAGFSRSYYTEIETGKRNISVLNLIKIIEALNVDPNEIISSLKPK